jgi:3-phosphoshikimate 1-carboxyvinyltransferase
MHLRGKPQLPGDKSISHRAAIFAAISEGTAAISNFSQSADCASTLECLAALGVNIERNGGRVIIEGRGKRGLRRPSAPLDCGNSGTTMRLLAGVLAGQKFDAVLDGDASLRSRPMERVRKPLELMGASVGTMKGKAPLRITGRNDLTAIEYEPPVASAQIKSCVLLTGLNANGTTAVIESAPTRDHTERMLAYLGADLRKDGLRTGISGDSILTAKNITIPGDISAAAFLITAALFTKGSEIHMQSVGMNPSRTSFLDVCKNIGADIEISNVKEISGEPVGDLTVRSTELASKETVRIEGSVIANLIDEIPIIAIMGTQLAGGIEVRDAAELRAKESDRIAAVVENLRRMNADVEEFPDGFRVGHSLLKGAELESHGDHRIAMAFAVASLFAEGDTAIKNKECADVSFPGFFEELDRLTVK